ncbi:RsmB/NOP family class I SAM-dependent RNA methyltransferase [Oricola cellulosilytica]|uniref:RsmB/NOP family class I SAM-dependent RNA methyltransferase n=1 Tax=Oricola cellulosilytica TaxID=1429082 RepID=A0A4R0PBK0_9HYPH|nr:RsmB/NOP family class I SAM-dependent RNA methyltransferase [Oricola cellulosilytica]TCD13317.1 RsmB/NOP family class I SAM-dependent RNA methyltransferase [Oricola cellulosilytica]
MRLGGRVGAAIEVLQDIETRRRPVADALKDWGLAHRFAGSGDRAVIGNLVHDALRKKLSTAHLMADDSPASLAFGTLWRQWSVSLAQMREAFAEDRFAPKIPEDALASALKRDFAFAAPYVEADVPDWTADFFEENFDHEWVAEAAALSERAPLDLRVNTLKADREKVRKQLSKAGAKDTPIARHGLRIAAGKGASRHPNVQVEPAFQKGWFEVQDEGSQIVADLVFPRPGEQVFDYCAGAGGKTLALAAAMENKGQVHAWDADKSRLAPIFERLKRAETRNVQVHAADADLSGLENRMERVLVDAPCTGSGTWRRNPDAKWRLQPSSLEKRLGEQASVLDAASKYVRPGGFLVYVTCSVFPQENEHQVYAFGDRHADYELLSAGEVWQELFGFDKPQPWSADMKCITLTPRATGTDGFFFAVMQRNG